MILQCPRCKQAIDISDLPQFMFQCPGCNEEIDLSRLREQTCPICCGEFVADDSIVICPDCKTVYHSECWDENRGCSTYGCNSTKHLETHTTSVDDAASGMIECPFCGASHASTDQVCPSCGHLLLDNANDGDDILGTVKTGLGTVRDEAQKSLPGLKRNFILLFNDVKIVLAMAWKAFARYVDFKGKASRDEYWAFILVCFLITRLLCLLQAELVAQIIAILCIVPGLAITVRRIRDTGLSPWMIFAIPLLPLLVLVPTVKEQDSYKEAT